MKIIQNILDSSQYGLNLFSKKFINELNNKVAVREENGEEKYYINCIIRDKEILLIAEEVIRQLYTKELISEYGYPKKRIKLDHPIKFGHSTKFADIVIFDKDKTSKEYLIVEIKKPQLLEGEAHLRSYCNASSAAIGVWLNGNQISHYYRKSYNSFEKLVDIPNNDQTLNDL